MKKILCLILAIIMVVGMVPVTVMADENNSEMTTTKETVAHGIGIEGLSDEKVSNIMSTEPSTVTVAQAMSRINTLISKLDGKAFTVSGKFCTSDGVNHSEEDYANDVVKTSWFENLIGMGTINPNNFPAIYWASGSKGSNTGWQCYGFACFAHWYIFAQKNTDNVVSDYVTKGALTYNTLKNALPGDVLQTNKWGDYGHTMIFISCDSSGFTVLDCNGIYNHKTKWCEITTHTYGYDSKFDVAITSTENYDRTSSGGHICSYDGNGYCTDSNCNKDYLATSEYSNSVVEKSGNVIPNAEADKDNLYVYNRPYSEARWNEDVVRYVVSNAKMLYECVNHYGNTWYCVSFYEESSKSVKKGYVYSGYSTYVSDTKTEPDSVTLDTVAERMTKILGLEGKYYTVTGEPHAYESGHGCADCGNEKMIDNTWFSVYLGIVPTNYKYIPGYRYSSTGVFLQNTESCVGFATMALWYLYADRCTDDVGTNMIALEEEFNETTINKAQMGDLISFVDKDGNHYHTMVFIEKVSGGIKVIDCNMGGTVHGNDLIQVRTEKYSDNTEYNVTINRASNAVEPNTYTVYYDTDGGVGGPSNQTKNHGENLTLSSTVPTKEGYLFKGWKAPSSTTKGEWTTTKPTSGSYETGYKFFTWGCECKDSKNHGGQYDDDYIFLSCMRKQVAIEEVQDRTDIYGSYSPSLIRYFWVVLDTKDGGPDSDGDWMCKIGESGSVVANYEGLDGSVGTYSVQNKTFWFESEVYRQDVTIEGKTYKQGDTYSENADLHLTAVWEETSTYKIIYYANEGTGAPAEQTKTKDVAITLSTTTPTREGYKFKGWATSATGKVATYQPGATYSNNADIDLYAVWEEISGTAPKITVSTVKAQKGKEIMVPISIENNPKLGALSFGIDYDHDKLEMVTDEESEVIFEAGIIGGSWTVGENGASWNNAVGSSVNGTILTIKFKVKDNVADGLVSISISDMEAVTADDEEVEIEVVAGGINVISRIPGDVNDDGKVGAADLLRLSKHCAKMQVVINASNSDVTGDGKVGAADLLRLSKYCAKMNVILE